MIDDEGLVDRDFVDVDADFGSDVVGVSVAAVSAEAGSKTEAGHMS